MICLINRREETSLPYRRISNRICPYSPIQSVEFNIPSLVCGLDLVTHTSKGQSVEREKS